MAREDRIDRLERLRYQRRSGARPGHGRRFGSTLVAFVLLCVLVVLGARFIATGFASALSTPEGASGTPSAHGTVVFDIKPDDSLSQVSDRLAAQKIVGNATIFYWYARLKGMDSNLSPGPYQVHVGAGFDQVIADLSPTATGAAMANTQNAPVLAPVHTVRVTIPEGWRIEEIAAQLAAQHVVAAKTFIYAARQGTWDTSYYTFLQGRPKGASLEGYLFPDTYDFAVYTDTVHTARQAIGQMLNEFSQQVTPALRTAITKEGLSLYQGITIASLVQREGQIDSELPHIAGVYMNRLHNLHRETNGYLGVDAAQRYFLGYDKQAASWWAVITPNDYNIPSPYNTFNPQHGHPGLPFGPICNPGLKAITAAAHPLKTDDQYYLATGDGSHAFAKTLADFTALKAQLGYQ
jgi:UPF0755 protein